jgi:hypothetical protein
MTDSTGASPRALDPIDRISEILFGLIVVLTFTGSLSVAEAAREDTRTMLIGALGCNLAAYGFSAGCCSLVGDDRRAGCDELVWHRGQLVSGVLTLRGGSPVPVVPTARPPVRTTGENSGDESLSRAPVTKACPNGRDKRCVIEGLIEVTFESRRLRPFVVTMLMRPLTAIIGTCRSP